ncbi:MAG: HAD family hydrolase [Alphaproteobacteria bacterium]|nr:HAD family hydrolase [Alphaproteobacteria bacterium]
MAKIFFDFDGTLINSQRRLYDLFCELCPESQMSYDDYWKIKRNRINQKDFLKKYFAYDDERIREFHRLWLQKIEEEERIAKDSPIKEMNDVLIRLNRTHQLYLITNRQDSSKVFRQLEQFGWKHLFKEVLVTRQKKSKQNLIKQTGCILPGDIFVSDTGEDIVAAKELGMISIAVCWGVLNKNILLEYHPDFLFERPEDFDKCKII